MRDQLSRTRHLQGRMALSYGQPSPVDFVHNDITADWCFFLQSLFLGPLARSDAYINGFLIEFENNSGNVVTPPVFDPDADQTAYYQSLAGNRDYLRCPVTGRDARKSAEDLRYNDLFVLQAQTTGSTGVQGLPFSSAAQSRVFGAAAAFLHPTDPSQDVVFSRAYTSNTANQLIKRAGGQITLTWEYLVSLG